MKTDAVEIIEEEIIPENDQIDFVEKDERYEQYKLSKRKKNRIPLNQFLLKEFRERNKKINLKELNEVTSLGEEMKIREECQSDKLTVKMEYKKPLPLNPYAVLEQKIVEGLRKYVNLIDNVRL